MQAVNIHEAKTHLSRRLKAVENGEETVIALADEPIVTLSAYKPPCKRTVPPGSLAGMGFWMADDFNEPINDLLDALKDDHAARPKCKR